MLQIFLLFALFLHTHSKPTYCPMGSYFEHETDCTKFYQCAPWGAQLMNCSSGTVFDPEINVCSWRRPGLCGWTTTEITTNPKKSKSFNRDLTEAPVIEIPGKKPYISTNISDSNIRLKDKARLNKAGSVNQSTDTEESKASTGEPVVSTEEPAERSSSFSTLSDYRRFAIILAIITLFTAALNGLAVVS
ncbi:uncharacterized protein LOC114338774 [Diabrotica virgifera virgifera]|uniref:Uncharacterized protein LOC114338774 n=1 Tax=Diabrotica virgifera virgifera TaxID=50390 RepID=A0A6P7GN16_DIAVI|nr:uncharacterized protein LOC114338774 [Diabrotica virgifera virgifera]